MAFFPDSVNPSQHITSGSVSHRHFDDRSAIDSAYYFNHQLQQPAAHLSLHPPFHYSYLPFMDVLSSHPSTTNTSGESPSSNTSNLSSTVVSTAGPVRKKPGRGPGKKDAKDRPAVSVRWDDGDLTDRLISAVESNERWLGVFAQVSTEPGQVRSSAPVAKRDLQREIARYLFQDDTRYDLNDRKVLESLAVSVKNKLFKLTTLFAECKQDLGDFGPFSNEREIPAGSELASLWARIKEKFPQFLRIQELMRRAATSPRPSVDPLSPAIETSHSHHVRPSTSPTVRTRPPSTNTSHPVISGHFTTGATGSSSLKGALDIPREASAYVDPTFVNNSATISPTYPMPSPRAQPSSGYGYPSHGTGPQRRAAGSFSAQNPGPPSRQASGGMGAPAVTGGQHHPTSIVTNFSASPSSAQTVRAAPYHHRPSISTSAEIHAALERLPESPSGGENAPSPPLTAAIQSIVSTLTERKDREKSRAHELEVLRLKREEAERIRWHQREMLRLKIQLIRAERNAAVMASTAPGAGPPHGVLGLPDGIGPVEDDLAIAAGLGDDGASMEGDGEGELEEEMFDPAPIGVHPHAPSTAITHEHLRAHQQGHSS